MSTGPGLFEASKAHAIHEALEELDRDLDMPDDLVGKAALGKFALYAFIQRLYQQSKQVSQIIAFIWRWADDKTASHELNREAANAIKSYFDCPTPLKTPKGKTPEIGKRLKKLLGADPDPKDHPVSLEGRLLRQVFPDYNQPQSETHLIFPIFSPLELGEKNGTLGYLFTVDVNSFWGKIDDPNLNTPELFELSIAYPPCPQKGEVTVTDQTLDHWIANRKKEQYIPTNPFIPTTCC